MRLIQLFPNLDKKIFSKIRNFDIKGIACNSKCVSKGYVFVAVKGTKEDGHRYINEAISNGAKVVIKQDKKESFVLDNGFLFINVKDTRRKLSEIAAKFYHEPSKKIKVIGITGTNGKTTISFLVDKILSEAGFDTGLIGTINYKYKDKIISATNTTPDSLKLQLLLSGMVKHKVDYCITEVSSHSLDQDRVAHVNFSSAIFTNLTQDHLDYHLTLKKYFSAKQKLFKNLKSSAWAIINRDDAFADRLLRETKANKLTYGIKNRADVTAKEIELNLNSSLFCVHTPKGDIKIKTELIGCHNIYNILAAIGLCVIENIDLDIIRDAIKKLKVIPGRLESIDCGQPFKVFVDYAHTEDALKNVLSISKNLNKGKIIVVFGCGGERDKKKRPKMGRVASKIADFIILTSDNSRSEDPLKIVKDISGGITTKNYKIILDRSKAIQEAVNLAKEQDLVLIAGKGHESYQIYDNKIVAFDDRKITRKLLRCLVRKKF